MNRWSRQRLVLPLPPVEMRELVGDPGLETFDHPAGEPVFPTVTPEQYASVFDFGCGCGRVARQLALAAAPMPGKYLGIDLHREMIDWCRENLAPQLRNFSFVHHDVFNPGFNPDPSLPRVAPFPLKDHSVTLLVAWSVFTHLLQTQAEYYMDEVARVLAPMGVMIATFFMFDKAYFPMMQEFQNALYINEDDLTNAVIFDRHWLVQSLESRGLRIRSADPPIIRGFQWRVEVVPGRDSIPLQEDDAPFGRIPPPVRRPDSPSS